MDIRKINSRAYPDQHAQDFVVAQFGCNRQCTRALLALGIGLQFFSKTKAGTVIYQMGKDICMPMTGGVK